MTRVIIITLALLGCTADVGPAEPIAVPLDILAPAEPSELEGLWIVEPDSAAHDLWFGDSDWYCCDQPYCEGLCEDGETPTTNGLTVCCSPDLGQCDHP